ncbi:uncharacterized protein LOC130450589 [Diorhabda sublineata]|uniref:uncharacterized protein LOC130450589 n=1 Tax=Diorhabda sublineata TaxID=1163346 RepID=UPI0024E163E4|nr:uncharacterized protein LOC130450589 [Diorhabda sublineata]
MKCTPMKLYQRVECPKKHLDKYFQGDLEERPKYFTQKHRGYSVSFVRKLFSDRKKSPKLSVNTLKLPENLPAYNTGSSMDKWSKKRPRLKSGDGKSFRKTLDVLDENAYDVNEIIEILDCTQVVDKPQDVEIDPDIEELWDKSRNGDYIGRNDKKENKSRKFSLSKPASPQTQQIIRVEISSTVSIIDYNQLQRKENFGKDLTHVEDHIKNNIEDKEEDFVVGRNQLSIETKQR